MRLRAPSILSTFPEALLRWLVSDNAWRDTVLGDLREELAKRQRRGDALARVWFWCEVLTLSCSGIGRLGQHEKRWWPPMFAGAAILSALTMILLGVSHSRLMNGLRVPDVSRPVVALVTGTGVSTMHVRHLLLDREPMPAIRIVTGPRPRNARQ